MHGKMIKITVLVLAVALAVAIPLFVGSTYATDANQISVPSDFTFYRINGTQKEEIVDGSTDPIFEYTLWEPGCVAVEYFTLEGDGAFLYGFQLAPGSDKLTQLAKVIDVYYLETEQPLPEDPQTALVGMQYLGTLDALICNDELFRSEGDGSVSFAVALQMRPGADNAYQGLSLYAENDVPRCFNVILKAGPKA